MILYFQKRIIQIRNKAFPIFYKSSINTYLLPNDNKIEIFLDNKAFIDSVISNESNKNKNKNDLFNKEYFLIGPIEPKETMINSYCLYNKEQFESQLLKYQNIFRNEMH